MSTKLATKSDYGAAPLDLGITKQLAAFLARLDYEDLSTDARRQAQRGIMDWAG